MINDCKYYLDLFQMTESSLDKLVAEAMREGAGFSDIFFESTTHNNLLLRDSSVGSGGYHIDFGAGIRAVKGEKTGFAYSESTAYEALEAAARSAASIGAAAADSAGADRPSAPRFTGKPNPAADRYPSLSDWRECSAAEFVPYLEKLDRTIRAKDSRVIKVIASLSSQVSDILIYNSYGEIKFDTRPLFGLSISTVFQQGDSIENTTVSGSFRSGAEALSEQFLESLACDAVRGIDERFEARRPKGGQMAVVMAAGASGILLHEAMGHAFEADFNRKGQSVFSGRIGEQICAKGINIVDDGTIRGNRGSVNFDDEGVPGQKTYMVEDGVLTSYLHDRISADFFGVRPTGNGRRESFRYNPIPRMRATYMESCNFTPEEIISSVKNGIFVDQFSNGQVKIGEGDFTFYVKSGRLIENGRLSAPIKDINIIGNGPRALADIAMVGNDLKIDNGTWTCGKEQSVPVSCGIPTVLVKNLTVGGE